MITRKAIITTSLLLLAALPAVHAEVVKAVLVNGCAVAKGGSCDINVPWPTPFTATYEFTCTPTSVSISGSTSQAATYYYGTQTTLGSASFANGVINVTNIGNGPTVTIAQFQCIGNQP